MNIRPTYSWVAFPTESPFYSEHLVKWENSVFNTHQKITTLYNHTCFFDVLRYNTQTTQTIWEVKDTVGLYVIKPDGSSTAVWKAMFVVQGQSYHREVGRNSLKMNSLMKIREIPNEMWYKQGFVVILPSIDTVKWLNKMSKDIGMFV